jgi:hypothetical protein
MRAIAPGSARTHVGSSAESSARESPTSNFASTERASSTSSDRSSTPASRRLRSKQLLRERGEPFGLAARGGAGRVPRPGPGPSGSAPRFRRPASARARSAACAARATRCSRTCAATAPALRGAVASSRSASEVPDLVAVTVVDRRRSVGPSLGHVQRAAAQRGQAEHEHAADTAGGERNRGVRLPASLVVRETGDEAVQLERRATSGKRSPASMSVPASRCPEPSNTNASAGRPSTLRLATAVEHERSHSEHLLAERSRAGPAQHGADATAQLGGAERLGDVVVRARFEAEHGVRLGVERRHAHRAG